MTTNGSAAGALSLLVPDDLVDAIARRVVELLPTSQTTEDDPWLDVEEAAERLRCPTSRIYDLKSQQRLRWAKDGSRLIFRRSWVDAVPEASE